MAGYCIYSLDWDRFSTLVERPTPEQLAILAQLVADYRDEADDYDDEDEDEDDEDDEDPIRGWPQDPTALARVVAGRLVLPDWYGDLSYGGKTVWESVIFSAALHGDEHGLDLGFRVEGDGCYWDVIELAWKEHNVPANTITSSAVSTFGIRPFRYHPPRRQRRDDWTAMHSMHPPDEVQRLRQELRSIVRAVEAASDDVRRDYNDELMPAVERVADAGRLLFVQVDT